MFKVLSRFLFILTIVSLLLVGCNTPQGAIIVTATPPPVTQTPWIITSVPDATPHPFATNTPSNGSYDHSCVGLPKNGFQIKNINPCLIGRVQAESEDGTPQCRPEQFLIYSNAVTVEGYPDEYSAHAAIQCTGDGYVFPVAQINGEWGFTTVATTLEAGCHIIKVTGTAEIADPEHPENYMAAAYLQVSGTRGEIELRRQQILLDDTFEIIWVFNVDGPASVFSTVTLIAGWGTAMEGSAITLQTFAVAGAPEGYCAGEVPGI